MAAGYIFGGNTGISGPEELASRRKVAEALLRNSTAQQPRSLGQGLSAIAQALSGRWAYNRLEDEEKQGRASGDAAYAPIIDALKNKQPVSNDMLTAAMGNQWMNPGQQGVVKALLGQNLEADAPLTKYQQAQLAENDTITPYQQAQIDIDKERNRVMGANGGGGAFGLNPIWAQDENGNWQLYQPNKGGGNPNRVNFPLGVTPQPQVNYHDTGTGFVGLTAKGGQPAGEVISKDVAGEANQKAIGQGQGQATVALPQIENSANMMLGSIDSLMADPYLPNMLGPVNSRTPNLTGDSARVQSKMDQIQGQTFLQAYNDLRGSGQITEVEGAKGEAAKARMATAQNEKDYREAAAELRGVVFNVLSAAKRRAGQELPQGLTGAGDPTAAGRIGGSRLKYNPATGELE